MNQPKNLCRPSMSAYNQTGELPVRSYNIARLSSIQRLEHMKILIMLSVALETENGLNYSAKHDPIK
jgi:hypothetical protein